MDIERRDIVGDEEIIAMLQPLNSWRQTRTGGYNCVTAGNANGKEGRTKIE